MFDEAEWPLFAAHARRDPRRAPRYTASLLALVGRRIAQNMRIRTQRDSHLGLKRRPAWLPPAAPAGSPDGGLNLPTLRLTGAMPEIAVQASCDNDPETHLARHRWATCAMALGDEARARGAFAEVQGWLSAPLAHSDPAWESYSCCERVVNLLVLLAAHPSLLVGADSRRLCAFIDESAAWIDGHLEYYGPVRTNNHFLNNGRALFVAGCVRGNEAWLATGLSILERFAPELFPVDGCLREGSSHYQLVVAGWLFDVLCFASLALPRTRLERLEALAHDAAGVCERLAKTLPEMDQHIGDISPDLDPRLTLARLRLLHGERLLHAKVGNALGEWLFADGGPSAVLAHAVRHWPQVHTSHAHADLGSLIWLRGGHAILADPGRRDYSSCPAARAQVGPAAHNTLLVNGVGPLAASVLRIGLWFPRPYADARVEVEAAPDGFLLRHDGFSRISDVGSHQREVRLVEDGLEVADHLEGLGSVDLELVWHFAPGWTDVGEGSLVSSFGRLLVTTESVRDAYWAWSRYSHSRAYGEVTSARRLSIRWRAELPCRVLTRMQFRTCAA